MNESNTWHTNSSYQQSFGLTIHLCPPERNRSEKILQQGSTVRVQHLTMEPNRTLILTHVTEVMRKVWTSSFFSARHLQSTREDTVTLHFCAQLPAWHTAPCRLLTVPITHILLISLPHTYYQLYSHIGTNVFSLFNYKFRLAEVVYLDAYHQIGMTEGIDSMMLKKSFISENLLELELNFIK